MSFSPSVETEIPAGREQVRLPLGPVTSTFEGSRTTFTSFGKTIGILPMRDIYYSISDFKSCVRLVFLVYLVYFVNPTDPINPRNPRNQINLPDMTKHLSTHVGL